MGTLNLLNSPLFVGYETHTVGTRWLGNPNQGHSHFLHHFWSSCECNVHYQREYSSCDRLMVI